MENKFKFRKDSKGSKCKKEIRDIDIISFLFAECA